MTRSLLKWILNVWNFWEGGGERSYGFLIKRTLKISQCFKWTTKQIFSKVLMKDISGLSNFIFLLGWALYTVKPVLRDHIYGKPPVSKDHILVEYPAQQCSSPPLIGTIFMHKKNKTICTYRRGVLWWDSASHAFTVPAGKNLYPF